MLDETTLYERILGLENPWYVEAVELDEDKKTISVYVALDEAAELCCPKCGNACSRYDTRQRKWRHLDTCQMKTLVIADVPRVQCKEHGCLTVGVPWAQERSRFTAMFESMIISWLKHASTSSVCSQFSLSWNAIDGIMQRAVARGLKRRKKRTHKRIGVDEVSFKKGRNYVTIVSSESGDVINVQDDRTAESLSRYYSTLSYHQRQSIEVVSMDLSNTYIKATKDAIPDAENKIAFDRFHVAKIITEAVDRVRKGERMNLARALNYRERKGNRFLWLRRHDNLDREQRSRLKSLNQIAVHTGRAWMLKEWATRLWQYNSRTWAEKGWRRWCTRVMRSQLIPMKWAAKTVKKHLWGIINAVVNLHLLTQCYYKFKNPALVTQPHNPIGASDLTGLQKTALVR